MVLEVLPDMGRELTAKIKECQPWELIGRTTRVDMGERRGALHR